MNLTWLCLKTGNRRSISSLRYSLLLKPQVVQPRLEPQQFGQIICTPWVPGSPQGGDSEETAQGDSKALVSSQILLLRAFLLQRVHLGAAD